jgi:hypothetical protein
VSTISKIKMPMPKSFATNTGILIAMASAPVISFAASMTTTLTIHADRPGAKINPAMWGIFFEDINFGADGGLYAELVKIAALNFPIRSWAGASTAHNSPKAK